jgi:L-2-hydroxycarboxylate dehydrogenase (NAD+)
MIINIHDFKTLFHKKLLILWVVDESSRIDIIDHYLNAEFRWKKTHGISKFLYDSQFYSDREEDNITIEKDKKNTLLINGNKGIWPLVMNACVDILLNRINEYGTVIIGLKNFQRYGSLFDFVEKIARKGYIAFITNNTEPFVLPFWGTAPLFWTNPIAIGIPTNKDPIVLDMSTSERSANSIWNTKDGILEDWIYTTKTWEYTTCAADVVGIRNFWGHKWYWISLVAEVLSSIPTAGNFSFNIKNDKYWTGAFFHVIDIASFCSIEYFKHQIDDLIVKIKNQGAFVPWEQSFLKYERNIQIGRIDLDDSIAQEFLF